MSLTNIFEEDAKVFQVKDDDLSGLSSLGKRAKELEKEILDIEIELKDRKEKYRKLTEETIPEALTSFNMKSFVMDDGSKVEVKAFYSASISEARRAEAFQWLRDHGFDDIIKNTVSVQFGRGEDELCVRLLNLLGGQGFPANQTEKVEPSTLKAWVKEQTERGNAFPQELFGAYIGKKATIKSA